MTNAINPLNMSDIVHSVSLSDNIPQAEMAEYIIVNIRMYFPPEICLNAVIPQ